MGNMLCCSDKISYEETSNECVIYDNPEVKYDFGDQLGQGGFGVVYKAIKKTDKNEYAIKKIKRKKSRNEEKSNLKSSIENETIQSQELTLIKNEVEALKKLDCPNIVKLIEFYITKDYFYLVTQFINGKTLEELLSEKKEKGIKSFDESYTSIVIYQVLQALNCTTGESNDDKKNIKNKIEHSDLKLENIMIENAKNEENPSGNQTKNEESQPGNQIKNEKNQPRNQTKNEENPLVKVIDYGEARVKELHLKKFDNGISGTTSYIAPEVLHSSLKDIGKRDLWSLGVVMYRMLTGEFPFNSKNIEDLSDEIIYKEVIPDPEYNISEHELFKKKYNVSEEGISFLKNLLTIDPEKRVSLEKALQDKWFEKFNVKYRLEELRIETKIKLLKNILNYNPTNVIQQTAIAYIVHNNQNKDCIKDVKALFNMMDDDKNGHISKEEFKIGLNKLWDAVKKDPGQSFLFNKENKKLIERAVELFDKIDSDHSGQIEFEEFCAATIEKKEVLKESNLGEAFIYIAEKAGNCRKNEKGKYQISSADLKDFFYKKNGSKFHKFDKFDDLERIINEYDKDKNGLIDFNEFCDMMKKMINKDQNSENDKSYFIEFF